MDLNIMLEPVTETQTYDLQVQIFKVLTHPARLGILEILRDGEHCVCHMEAYLGFRQAYISQQLAVLREAGLICGETEGPATCYCLDANGIQWLKDQVGKWLPECCSQKPEPEKSLIHL